MMEVDGDLKRREVERKELGGCMAAKYEDAETINYWRRRTLLTLQSFINFNAQIRQPSKEQQALIDDLINDDNERVERLMRRCEDVIMFFMYAARC